MIDAIGREINYIRISVTDLCDFRCLYCMPPEGVESLPHDEILRFEEIVRVVRTAVPLGIDRVRLTGGEPLVKRGIIDLVGQLGAIDGLQDLAMTTNASRLESLAAELKLRGLNRVNISIDSLNPERFRRITRGGDLNNILAGIEKALSVGLHPVKLNVVAMRNINDDEFIDFARLSLEKPINVRFIEYMPHPSLRISREEHLIPIGEIKDRLESVFPLALLNEKLGCGPSLTYRIEGAAGTVGFIPAISEPFCSRCNRVRLTADGKLVACLINGGEVDIKIILRKGGTQQDLIRAFEEVVRKKPLRHAGERSLDMSRIGG